MAEKTVTIASRSGLHARPAALFAKAAGEQGIAVTIGRAGEDKTVPANSILMLMTLGAAFGDQVTLHAEGEGAEAALETLGAMLERDLDED